jgi:hypothetical protein
MVKNSPRGNSQIQVFDHQNFAVITLLHALKFDKYFRLHFSQTLIPVFANLGGLVILYQ